MTFNRKVLLGTVAAFALAGQANAVTVDGVTVGGTGATTIAPYTLASELDIVGTPVSGTVTVDVLASTGALPSGNLVLEVTLTGAEFSANLTGAAVGDNGCIIDTAVISTDGAAGDSTVRFIISGADDCVAGTGATVTLPVTLTGGSVSVQAGYETELGSPVDGSQQSVSNFITFASAFQPTAAASSSDPVLSIASEFKDFLGGNAGLANLGTVSVVHTPQFVDLANTPTDTDDVTDVTVVVTGNFAGFGNTASDTRLEIDGDAATHTLTTATLVDTAAEAEEYAVSARNVDIDVFTAGVGVLSASGYSVVVTAAYDDGEGYSTSTESSVSTALEETTREGTTLIFPWTASATLGGSNNLIRIGNLTNTDITGVYARVVNQSAGGVATIGTLEDLGLTIEGQGEVLIDSAMLEAELGNFGRADVEIVIEADAANLTTRRLVVRSNGNVFDFGEGEN